MSVKTDAIELAIVEYTEDDAQAEAIRSELIAIKAELAELDRLRTLLASGQCVDLARVTDHQLGLLATDAIESNADIGEATRAWLKWNAGVKL